MNRNLVDKDSLVNELAKMKISMIRLFIVCFTILALLILGLYFI